MKDELTIKDKIGYTTAVVSFILGWILLFAGFIVDPLGEINGSVLTAFGTALVYTASFLGVALYFTGKDAIYAQKLKELEDRFVNKH